MLITLNDDFDVYKIAESGQIFRAYKKDAGYLFFSRDKLLFVKQVKSCDEEQAVIDVSCTEEEWNGFWKDYFDMGRDYSWIRRKASGDLFFNEASNFGKGIRILRQDPWEMLISFIISQRKSIPAIRTSIEKLCESFGEKKTVGDNSFYAFPTPEALVAADTEILAGCGLGYRLDYIRDASYKVLHGELDLQALYSLSDDELLATLKTVKGVGDKVANCIMLFAYSRFSRVPIDVWVNKIITEDFGGINRFEEYGDVSGIMQQYAFFYKRSEKR